MRALIVEDMLGDKEWTEKHEHFYCVIESAETERDMAKMHRKELTTKLKIAEEALENILGNERADVVGHVYIHDLAMDALSQLRQEEKKK